MIAHLSELELSELSDIEVLVVSRLIRVSSILREADEHSDWADVIDQARSLIASRRAILKEQAQEIAVLRAALKNCADALEAWVDDLYARGSLPGGYGEKYERDVAVVNAARAALKGENG